MTEISVARQEWLLAAAYDVAQQSPDPSTQVGVVTWSNEAKRILTGSANVFTRGVEATPERLERPLKYTFIEHAERNAVFKFAHLRMERPLDTVMAATWAACADCARAIVQSGITTLIRHADIHMYAPDRWKESIAVADEILEAGEVEIVDFYGTVPAPAIRHNGAMWNPRTLTLGEAE